MTDSKRHTILLVDDEADVLLIYKTKLQREGYEVLAAQNGAEAIEIAKTKHPDLILMDEKMPVMDGITAGRTLKEDPATKDIQVVYLTAFSGPASVQQDLAFLKKDDAPDFLKKGIGLEELVEKVRGYLKSSA